MKPSLKSKMILSFLSVALITVLVVSALIRLTSNQSLMNLVAEQQTAMMEESVKTYYADHGSLEGFFDYYQKINRPDPNSFPPNEDNQHPEFKDFRGVQGLVDAEYYALIPTFEYRIGDLVPQEKLKNLTPIEVDGSVIAYIIPDTKFEFKLSAEEELYLKRTTLAISLAAAAGVIVAVAMGFVLANTLVKPIHRLTKASKALAHGDYQEDLPVTSQDELGQLTETFNQMRNDLVKADDQRKRLTADITHDLSTPLQVISGYIEMLESGEFELTPQRAEIIKTEIEHLRRLVGDLSTLTQVEASELEMQLQPVPASVIMERIFQAFLPISNRKGVQLELDTPVLSPYINVDEGRMMQVLRNLVENALRYTSKGGKIILRVSENEQVQLNVVDTGIGIDPEDLPYVFDRFFQADKARGGNSGKMGLGLSICKALVTAQGGKIAASSAGKGKGTTMTISFEPAKQNE